MRAQIDCGFTPSIHRPHLQCAIIQQSFMREEVQHCIPKSTLRGGANAGIKIISAKSNEPTCHLYLAPLLNGDKDVACGCKSADQFFIQWLRDRIEGGIEAGAIEMGRESGRHCVTFMKRASATATEASPLLSSMARAALTVSTSRVPIDSNVTFTLRPV